MNTTHKVIIGCTVGACLFAYGLFELLPQYRLYKLRAELALSPERAVVQQEYNKCIRNAGTQSIICKQRFDNEYELCKLDKTNKLFEEHYGFLPSSCKIFKVRK